MTVSRRRALSVLGGGVILGAAAVGGFLATRTPRTALEPWDAAGAFEDPRKKALSYALLAPNPHNRQPWLVDLGTPDTVILHVDETRLLPQTDPMQRQITIGIGCFLELMTIAASQSGNTVDLQIYPDGENGPAAIARFTQGAAPDPLFAHVMDRRSCKEPFESTPVPAGLVAELEDYADIITDDTKVAALRELTLAAWMTEAQTPRTHKESVDLMRLGKAEINANPDGIDLGGPFLETLMLVGALNREALLDPDSRSSVEGARMYAEMLGATPAYAVLTSQTNTRADQIAAGRRWLRLNLATTARGLALHPVSQALQEFPEMAPHFDRAHTLLASEGGTVQMLGRLGFGPSAPRTPRWPLETRVLNG